MPVKEASSEETPYGRYVTSAGWFVHNLSGALAVRNEEKGGALYPIEPRESPFDDFGANVRVLWPGDPNALYHAEGVQEGIPRPRRRGRRAVRDSDDRRAAGGGDAPLPGQRGGGEVRSIRREGDRQPRPGVRRLAGRVPADAPSVAARCRREAVTRLGQRPGVSPKSERPDGGRSAR